MNFIAVPQRISITPAPPKFARGPKPPKGGFRFDILKEPEDRKGYVIRAKLFAQAFVKTKSGNSGNVDYFLLVDGQPVRGTSLKKGRFQGRFDPNDFPPRQPLTFFEEVEFDVITLRGLHHLTIKPGIRSEFDKLTVFDIHLEILSAV